MLHTDNLLLAGLTGPDFALLEPHLAFRPLPLGLVLCEAGHEVERIYFPHSGVISLLNVLLDGSEVEACTMGRDTGFGLVAAQQPGRSFTRDIVQIAGAGSTLDARRLQVACGQSASLVALVDRHRHAVLGFMAQSVACNARHRLEARLCRWLLTCADYVAGDELPLKQEFIGMMLGVHRTTVTDACAVLQDDGLLSVLRGRITLLQRDRLLARACECYAVTRARVAEALAPR